MGAEQEDGLREAGDRYRWGPCVSERQRGTVGADDILRLYGPKAQQ